MKGDMQNYELTFILGEKATPEEGKAKTEEVKKLIEKLKGSVTKEELWGRRELAYEIKRNRSGFYVTLWFDFPSDQINALERELRFDENVIRFLTTKAYTTAQPGTLYPVAEGDKEKAEKPGKADKSEQATAEEMLRRSSSASTKEKDEADEEEMPEEERLEKLDDALEELLKDEE